MSSSLILFQNVRTIRTAVLTEIAKRVSQMTREEGAFQSMALDLIEAPKTRRYIEESTIVENLFEYGQASRKLRFPGEVALYFESTTEVRARMSQLYDYWRGSVDINCDGSDGSMVEITFRVKRPEEL